MDIFEPDVIYADPTPLLSREEVRVFKPAATKLREYEVGGIKYSSWRCEIDGSRFSIMEDE